MVIYLVLLLLFYHPDSEARRVTKVSSIYILEVSTSGDYVQVLALCCGSEIYIYVTYHVNLIFLLLFCFFHRMIKMNVSNMKPVC